MPQPIFHLYLAEYVQEYIPLPDRPATRNAFLHGAIAPDVGFFPGAPKRWSTVVHHWRTADMCRAMLGSATTDAERAFVWGWVTHLLADALLHPIINRWCVQQLGIGSSMAEQLRLHVQLEIGIDVMHVTAVKRVGVPTFRSMFEESSVSFLTNAYEKTYALHVDSRAVLKAHRNLERLTRQLLELELVMAGAAETTLTAVPNRVALNVLRTAAAVSSGPRSLVTAFLQPVLPPLELGLHFRDQLDKFARWFAECVATELQVLPNLDLDTGQPIDDDTGFAVA